MPFSSTLQILATSCLLLLATELAAQSSADSGGSHRSDVTDSGSGDCSKDDKHSGAEAETKSCNPSSGLEPGPDAAKTAGTAEQATAAEKNRAATARSKAGARHNASVAIAENLQNPKLMREILGDRKLIFFGRLEPDLATYQVPLLDGDSGFEIRRFRVGVAGVNPRWQNISFKFELDLTDGTSTLSSMFARWQLDTASSLTVGYQDVVQNLSAQTGSLSQLFMEAPQPVDTFSLSKRLGIGYDRYAKRSGFHAMVFGHDPNNSNDSRGMATRAYFNPYRADDGIFHLGAAAVWEQVDETLRLRSRPESHVTDVRLVDTGQFNDVDTQVHASVEMAGAKGAFTARAEFFRTHWKRQGVSNDKFYGAYWEGGYFLTGQSFNYRNGKFVRPQLKAGETAWELGVRLSWVNLNDGLIQGGEERNAGIALNYYPRTNIRGQFNLIQVNSDRVGGDGYLAQCRLQFNW